MQMKSKFSQSITFRILLVAVVPSLVLFLMIATFFLVSTGEQMDSALEKQGTLIAEQAALNSQYGIISGNTDVIRKSLLSILNFEDVVSIVATDLSQDISVQLGEINSQDRLFVSPIVMEIENNVDTFSGFQLESDSTPASVSTRKIGEIKVYISDARLLQEWYRSLGQGGAAALFALFISGVVGSLLGLNITRPVEGVAKKVAAITKGDYTTDVKPNRKDEIGALEKNVDQLASVLALSTKQNQLKSSYLANISHEIRNPLNAVIAFVGLAKQLATNKVQDDYLNEADNASEHLLRIVNDVLDIEKIEAERFELEIGVVNLQQLVISTVALVQEAANAKGILLSLPDFSIIPVAYYADETRLKQIYLNLLSNAVKFTDSGSVSMDIEAMSIADGVVKLKHSVKDSGIGINPQIQAQVFDPYLQDEDAINRSQGTGLGLYITKKLVGFMGGDIWVESESGNGSRFYFTTQFRLASEEDSVERHNVSSTANKSMTSADEMPQYIGAEVMVVDDSVSNTKAMVEILSKYGIRVVECNSALDALNQLSRRQGIAGSQERSQTENYKFSPLVANPGNSIDLIFMDIRMPDIDGYEATKRIRSQFGDVVSIVALTANALKGEKEKCLAVGMNDFISKPLRINALLNVLDRVLYKYRASSQLIVNSRDSRFLSLPHLNLDFVQTEYGHDVDLIILDLQHFFNDFNSVVDELTEAVFEQNTLDVRDIAHRLRSSAANVGAVELSSAAALIDDFLQEENSESDVDYKDIVEFRELLADIMPKVLSSVKLQMRHLKTLSLEPVI